MKLKSLITYQCWTTIKPVCIYFSIVYGIVLFGNLCSYIMTGSFDAVIFNGIEISSCIYLGVSGSLGYKEDFKMAMQNGFTRKYIVIAAISMFLFLACVMGLVDMIAANILDDVLPRYNSLIITLYGSTNYAIQWLLISLLYVTVAIISYLSVTICNKVGTKKFLLAVIALLLIIFAIIPVFVPTLWKNITDFIVKAMGYQASGEINFLYPIISLITLFVIIASGTCLMIKRTELK